MKFDVITIFPNILDSYINESLVARARNKKLIDIRVHNLRDFSQDRRHKKVDDRPFGGGPGMVIQIEPVYRAMKILKTKNSKLKARTILFSTRGKKFDAKTAKRLSKYNGLILICGRYEGVDERVAQYIADEEISMGDYILSGGELPALILIEAVSRFIPGFLGKRESLEEMNGSFPSYTRPEVFIPKRGTAWKTPSVLLSGDREKIEAWRKRNSSRAN